MSKKLKLTPGRRHERTKNSGHAHMGKRKIWYEVLHTCGAVTKGSLGFIKRCSGGAANDAKNREVKAGCGMYLSTKG